MLFLRFAGLFLKFMEVEVSEVCFFSKYALFFLVFDIEIEDTHWKFGLIMIESLRKKVNCSFAHFYYCNKNPYSKEEILYNIHYCQ